MYTVGFFFVLIFNFLIPSSIIYIYIYIIVIQRVLRKISNKIKTLRYKNQYHHKIPCLCTFVGSFSTTQRTSNMWFCSNCFGSYYKVKNSRYADPNYAHSSHASNEMSHSVFFERSQSVFFFFFVHVFLFLPHKK